MAERNIKLDFKGTSYIVIIDSRSFTLKKENKPNDKFPSPLGYHRSMVTLVDCLFRRGFMQVGKDSTIVKFAKDFKQMWEKDIKPFILTISENQQELQQQLISESKKTNQQYKKLAKLVNDGDYQGAAKIAKTLDTD